MSLSQISNMLVKFAVLAVLVAAALLVAREGWPHFARWHKGQLAADLADEIRTAPDNRATLYVSQLAALGTSAIDELVAAAHDSREVVAAKAQAEVNLLYAARRLSFSEDPTTEDVAALTSLAAALANNATEFGPRGRRWAEVIMLQLVDLSEGFPPKQTAAVLRRSDELLAAIPPSGPRLQSATREIAPTEPTQSVTLDAPPLDVERFDIPSEIALRPQTRVPVKSSTNAAVEPDTTPNTPDDSTLRVQPNNRFPTTIDDVNVKTLPWHTSGGSSLSVDVGEQDEALELPVTPKDSNLIDVPSPLESQRRIARLRKLSTRTLLEKLPHADRFSAGTIRYVLERRGLSRAELEMTSAILTSEQPQRLAMIDQATRLPSKSARRILRILAEDSSAEVRLRALSTLATTNDPGLAELAREIALRDSDPRVAELAAELMQR